MVLVNARLLVLWLSMRRRFAWPLTLPHVGRRLLTALCAVVHGSSHLVSERSMRCLTGALKLTGGLPRLNDAEQEHRYSEPVDAGKARSLTLVR